MDNSAQARLLVAAVLGIGALVFLVVRVRLSAFIALFVVSLGIGLSTGLPWNTVTKSFTTGMGGVLGSIALIIALGSVLGRLLEVSRGAEMIAHRCLDGAPARFLPILVAAVSFVLGFPVWFSVGLVLLLPVCLSLAEKSGLPLMTIALPLLAGLATSHGLVPPHPGPVAAIQILGADTGRTLLWSMAIGLPVAIGSALLVGVWCRGLVGFPSPSAPNATAHSNHAPAAPAPALRASLALLFPLGLMLSGSVAGLALKPDSPVYACLAFLGDPNVAMTLGVLLAMILLGVARGLSADRLLRETESCLGPVAVVLLVVGAGGGLSRVLIDSRVGEAVSEVFRSWSLPPLLTGWLLAASIRIAVGSATVALTTSAGLIAPMLGSSPEVSRELMVVALGSGASIASHVNDGGFWMVKELLGLTVAQTLRTWTVLTTVIALAGLLLAMLAQSLGST